MRRSIELHKNISRRAMIIGGVKTIAMAGLFSRLYYLQFIKSSSYKTRAEDNRIKVQMVAPSRGLIVDRNMRVMVRNETYYRLMIEKVRDKKASNNTLTKISSLINLPLPKYHKLKKKLSETPIGRTITVKSSLSSTEIIKLKFNIPNLPSMVIAEREKRKYNLAEAAAHVIGNVGAVTKQELKPDAPVLQIPEFKIGKKGVEKSRDKMLIGTAGLEYFEVNAKGLLLKKLKTKDSISGGQSRLTIDSKLQRFCHQRMGDESGAIIVMDVNNGEILAMSSSPAFNPDIFSSTIPHKYWNSLLNNPKAPLVNKAIAGQYPPGSTFKMMVALAGLEAGIINEKTTFHCPGYFHLGRHRFNCWRAGGHGTVNVNKAIEQSCDTFFYHVGNKLGIDKITEMAREFGFGNSLNIDIPNEKKGLLPSDKWKRKYRHEPWQGGDTINSSIGQGFVLATPLQLAIMTARIANGGKIIFPQIFMDYKENSIITEQMNLNPKNLAIIQKAMFSVVNSTRGTAYGKRIDDPEMAMAGKTGTSQVRRITRRGVKQSSLPWNERHHALFVAFAPFDKPKYAISVIVEHGGGGSSAAAPIAKDVMLETFRLGIT